MSKRKRNRGPAIVAVGGGTGLSTILRGLKQCTDDLTAIVTVADDGGGSGVLREDLGMLPPGDIRHCMEALADQESLMQQLLAYRYPDGRLAGQAFGNLLLAALNGVSGSFDQAVARMGEILAITGQILPVTNTDVQLEAVFDDGSTVLGESKICLFKKEKACRVHHVRLLPEHPPALPAAVEAIRRAEVLLLGPGSLYTSVIPNLLVDGIAEAMQESKALKIYISNIMTEDGETEGMTAADHLSALLEHGGPGLIQICLCNSQTFDGDLLERYHAENAVPLLVDPEAIALLGAEAVLRPLADGTGRLARHSGAKVAEAVMELYHQRADTRIF